MRLIDSPYYVYRHIRPDTQQVFYVGKGIWTTHHRYDRAYSPLHAKNQIWKRVVDKNDGKFEAEIMMHLPTNEECLTKEIELIALYGRIDRKTGTLANLTDGGQGSLGRIYSADERRERSLRIAGVNHPNWGKHLSAEACERKSQAILGTKHHLYGKKLPVEWCERIATGKIGDRNPMYGKPSPRRREVLNLVTGARYPSVTMAAKTHGHRCSALHNMLTGFRKNWTSLRFA